jgi:hypothetical protein
MSAMTTAAIAPVNFFRRSWGSRLLGPLAGGLALLVLAAGLAGGGLGPFALAIWGAILLVASIFTLNTWTDGFELDGATLVYHAPLARLVGRPVRREFPLRDCAVQRVERRMARLLKVRNGKDSLLIEGIEGWDELARRIDQVKGGAA